MLIRNIYRASRTYITFILRASVTAAADSDDDCGVGQASCDHAAFERAKSELPASKPGHARRPSLHGRPYAIHGSPREGRGGWYSGSCLLASIKLVAATAEFYFGPCQQYAGQEWYDRQRSGTTKRTSRFGTGVLALDSILFDRLFSTGTGRNIAGRSMPLTKSGPLMY